MGSLHLHWSRWQSNFFYVAPPGLGNEGGRLYPGLRGARSSPRSNLSCGNYRPTGFKTADFKRVSKIEALNVYVQGRSDDILFVQSGNRKIALLPLAISTVVEETRWVQGFQLIEHLDKSWHVRLKIHENANPESVRAEVEMNLKNFLHNQGCGEFPKIYFENEMPIRGHKTGKFRQVFRLSG